MKQFINLIVFFFSFTLWGPPLSADEIPNAKSRASMPIYEHYFEDAALRVDLIHTGTRGQEFFGIDEMVREPLWPGPRRHLIDPTGYGKYRFRIFDQATSREIFSMGYCTLFGEWMATDEAKSGTYRSMPEPIRFPFPQKPIILQIEGRGEKDGEFHKIQSLSIDPQNYHIRENLAYDFNVRALHQASAPPAKTVDVLFVPDGYTAKEHKKMVADAQRFTRTLMTHAPFDKYAESIAVRLVEAFSKESGTDEPRKGIFRNTIIDTTFDTFYSPRYLTTTNLKKLREIAALAPYDTIIVMVNTNRYGGGGIFGTYSIFSSDNEYDEYVFIHEFGHGFGALGDEYYTSSTGYDENAFYAKGVEPWEPNITSNVNVKELKWRHLLTPNTPIPTPDTEDYNNVVGLFEGAGYKAKGLYRATRNSKMFHKGLLEFGPVNETAITKMIQYVSDREKPE